MKPVLRFLSRWTHAFNLRSELARELLRMQARDGGGAKGAWSDLLRRPAAIDDALYIGRFVGRETPVLIADVGGNKGEWAAKMLRFFPQATLRGFEPSSHEYGAYCARFKGLRQVAAYHVALSDAPGVGRLAVAADTHYSRLDGAGAPEGATEEVVIKRLDDYASELLPLARAAQFRILKIDVQGHELSVIKGAEKVLDLFDLVYLECSFVAHAGAVPTFAAACRALLPYDLHPVIFRDFGRDSGPHALERDVIFVKAERSHEIVGA